MKHKTPSVSQGRKGAASMLLEGYQAAAEAAAPSFTFFRPLLTSTGLTTNWEKVRKQRIIYLKAVERDAKFLTITFRLADQNEWEIFFFPNASIVLGMKIEYYIDSFSM